MKRSATGNKTTNATVLKSPAYVRFLNLIDVLDRINPGKKLDATEKSLLDKIVLSAHQGQFSRRELLFQGISKALHSVS
jgi:hypothetical protein